GVYIVPSILKVGATYSLRDQTPAVTEDGRMELTRKLNQLVSFPYSIVNQQWGMRPTTHDRRPILGPHPEFEQLVIFNGLGTKGISLAPYFSEILTLWMEKGRPIDNVVAINRYKSLYWKSA
ncbi:MAG: FAD-dependent oxidoreductase, partial [Cyclobacteriaceae bacterium]|nr:FAD-dependent oxidoreductase [Cyclobacteriaceae bacterium]